jgi:signal transduction histidine kinase
MADRVFRVLLIEDDPNDVRLIKRALNNGRTVFELSDFCDLAAGLDAASTADWDVVLADLSLPDCQGLDTVRRLRACAPNLPIVVLTGLASDESALISLDHGAQDYLVKDLVTPQVLERSILYAVQRQKSREMRRLLEQLRASERALEKKNRRLARLYKTAHRFVDNVSHEFRTPLTVINEYVSLLRDGILGALDDQQSRILDVIGDRAEDLNNMVDDMLDISRLEAGMLGLWRCPCRIENIVHHVRPSLVRKSIVKEVELQFDIPEHLPEVFCDDEKIGRVLINLTVNAIKFCGRPGRVQVWAKYHEEEHAMLVGVTDNGQGISPENYEAIFQRFKQVGGNPRGSTKGFGLGLNIAKELVHLNLGEIGLKSTLGQGSTFWFTVPIADAKEVMSRYAKRISQFQNGPVAVSLASVTTAEPADASLANDVNTFLNTLLRKHDLVFRTDENLWLLAVPCEQSELDLLVARAEEARQQFNRNRPAEPLPPLAFTPRGTWLVSEGLSGFLQGVTQTLNLPLVAAS